MTRNYHRTCIKATTLQNYQLQDNLQHCCVVSVLCYRRQSKFKPSTTLHLCSCALLLNQFISAACVTLALLSIYLC